MPRPLLPAMRGSGFVPSLGPRGVVAPWGPAWARGLAGTPPLRAASRGGSNEDELERVRARIKVQEEERDRLAGLLKDDAAIIAEFNTLQAANKTLSATPKEYKAELKEQLATVNEQYAAAERELDRLLKQQAPRTTLKLNDFDWSNLQPKHANGFAFNWVPRASAEEETVAKAIDDIVSYAERSKTFFRPPLINGQMGSGKTRLAYHACLSAAAKYKKMGYKVFHAMVNLQNFLPDNKITPLENLLVAAIRGYKDLNLADDVTVPAILRKLKEEAHFNFVLLHIDEYQARWDTSLHVLSLARDQFENGDRSAALLVPVFSGLSPVNQAELVTKSGTSPTTITLGAFSGDLAALQQQLVEKVVSETSSRHKVSEELVRLRLFPSQISATPQDENPPNDSLAHLVADLGGIPRFYELLSRVLVDSYATWSRETGLDVSAAKKIYPKLIDKVNERYGLPTWRQTTCRHLPKEAQRAVVTHLFSTALAGLPVELSRKIHPGYQDAATYLELVESGLVTFANQERDIDEPGLIVFPLIVVAAANQELNIVDDECVNPFATGWPETERLQLEKLRLRLNVLAADAPDRKVELSQLRVGKVFYSPGWSETQSDAYSVIVPEGGIPPPLRLNESISDGTNLLEAQPAGLAKVDLSSGRLLLCTMNQKGIDSIGVFEASPSGHIVFAKPSKGPGTGFRHPADRSAAHCGEHARARQSCGRDKQAGRRRSVRLGPFLDKARGSVAKRRRRPSRRARHVLRDHVGGLPQGTGTGVW